ncbi:MAG: cyclic nucleotide-binding/CBS domain-containing protein [Nitrospirae bacterium]|nr:cyclic nucleotide-binding/CBS domain-containing protein [Nitrospirota bacterium]
MTVKDVKEFLGNIQPFLELDDDALDNIAGGVIVEFYPKNTLILQQDGPPSDFLRVIKKGGVKIFISPDINEEIVLDYRTEGDSFGMLSIIRGDKSRANVATVEDTICYLISKEAVKRLLDSHAAFSEYFLKSFLNKYIDRTFSEMHNKSLLYGGGDKLLFTTTVEELSSGNVVTVPQEVSIKDSAEVMSKRKISSLVLVDQDNLPAGIVTDRDLRDKVVSKGRNTADPVSSIMSVPLMKAEAKEYCFEALLKMIRYNIHHLLVVDGGKLKGIITNHDLMMLQGASPISVVRDIETRQSVEELAPVSRKVNRIVNLLLKEGAKAGNITRIISEVNDRLLRRVLEMAERKLGRPPVNYCFIVFGSEGRKEQTFKTDQDNAIIYEDPKSAADGKKAAEYFRGFSAFVRDSLVACGFPVCPAGYMASTPQWRQPLTVWKDYFLKWINTPTPDSILFSLIFFDFRPVHGDTGLAEGLRSYLKRILKNQNVFFARMAAVVVNNRPPLGFFKSFIVEKSGEHKDELNLKFRGASPVVDIARLFALELGLAETSTFERLRALRDKHPIITELGEEMEQTFEFISLLRIHHQIKRIEQSLEPDNFINPGNLSNLERKSLKESFQLVLRVQDAILELYRPGMVTQ